MPAGHAAETLCQVAETYRKACKAGYWDIGTLMVVGISWGILFFVAVVGGLWCVVELGVMCATPTKSCDSGGDIFDLRIARIFLIDFNP